MNYTSNQTTSLSNQGPFLVKRNGFKSKKWLFLTIVLLLIAIVVYLLLNLKPPNTYQAPTSVSTTDKSSQEVIRDLTGYDWANLPKNLGGSSKDKLTMLMLAYNEESSVFFPEVTTVTLNSAEVKELKLESLQEEVSKDNLSKLFDRLLSIEKKYGEKGLIPADDHISRLTTLKNYFTKHTLSQKDKVPEDAKKISSDIKVASDQLDYAKVLLVRYNNWLTYVSVQ